MADSLPDATPISITAPGEVVSLEVELAAGGSVTGRLLSDYESLRDYSWIVVEAIDGHFADDEAARVSRLDGSFWATGLPNGRFRIGARGSRATPVNWYLGTTDSAQAQPIVIEDHQTVEDIEWHPED